MPTFSQGDTVRVPFPYTDRATRQRRPALVVSASAPGETGGLLWVVMITSAENRPWAGDVSLGASGPLAGLSAPSVIRPCKIATIDAGDVQPLGRIDDDVLGEVMGTLRACLGIGVA